MTKERTTIASHIKGYEHPIILSRNDKIIIKEWGDSQLWVWGVNERQQEGWIPINILEINDDEAITLKDYDATEMTIGIGETVHILEENSGWYWCENATGELGWIPVTCFDKV